MRVIGCPKKIACTLRERESKYTGCTDEHTIQCQRNIHTQRNVMLFCYFHGSKNVLAISAIHVYIIYRTRPCNSDMFLASTIKKILVVKIQLVIIAPTHHPTSNRRPPHSPTARRARRGPFARPPFSSRARRGAPATTLAPASGRAEEESPAGGAPATIMQNNYGK